MKKLELGAGLRSSLRNLGTSIIIDIWVTKHDSQKLNLIKKGNQNLLKPVQNNSDAL